MMNHRSEEDYKMVLKMVCAKSEGVDDCNTEDLLNFSRGITTWLMKYFYRPNIIDLPI